MKKLTDKRKLRDFFRTGLADCRTAQPRCRHFGDCGGCEFQDVPYPQQLAAKQKAFAYILAEVIADFESKAAAAKETADADAFRVKAARLRAAFAGGEIPDIVPSPLPLGYRQRMDYVFAFGLAGLRRVNRHRQVVALEKCPLLGEQGFAVMQAARTLADEAGLESYDYMRHTGELRYFVVRRSRNRQILLSLVTKSEDARDAVAAILQRLVADGSVTSGHWLLAPGLGDVSFGTEMAAFGSDVITETMNGLALAIGPNTFFQSNPAVAESAYASIRDFAPDGGSVLDMYSGAASIAATVASKAGTVTAVENVPANIALAERNLRTNAIANVSLVIDDSTRYLRELSLDTARERPGLVIVNPPRPGVEGDGMRDLKALGAAKLAYLSCNPFTLLRNLADVLDEYTLRSLTLYDMFPQTRHFESLALLSH